MSSAPPLPPLDEFAQGLFTTGQALVRRGANLAEHAVGAQAMLADAFHATQLELAQGEGPPLQWLPETSLEGLRFLYQICVALNDRALEDHEVAAIFEQMPPAAQTPSEALNLGLTLRHLPDLHRSARALSPEDVLVHGLAKAAARFPLSSVGIALDPPPDLSLLRSHAGLWQLYIDRVTERQDVSRLRDPSVSEAVRNALGLHASLAPQLAAQLAVDAAA